MLEDEELLTIRIRAVERNKKTLSDDLKQGYVYFVVDMEVNGRALQIKKKIRLDKPEKMLNKFMTKIPRLAEEHYKEVKYFVADKPAPDFLDAELINRAAVEDKVLLMLEEVEQYMKSGKGEVLATDRISF